MAELSFRENTLLAYQHRVPEYLPMGSDRDLCAPWGADFINENGYGRGQGEVTSDWFGQSWTYEANIGGANPTPGRCLVRDITRWRETMTFPDLDRLDWEGHAARDTAGWDRERRLSCVKVGIGMWERMFSVMDFQEALMALLLEPEACYDFFDAVAEHKVRLYKRIIRYYKPDLVVMHDDYGSGAGMFMSPDTWRELLKPHLQRIIDAVTEEGVMYEHHCCGYFAPILGEIADMGCVATNNVHVSNHPAELKKQLGHKMCFVGGFDTQFMEIGNTTEEQIRASVRQTIDDLAPGGSFVALTNVKDPARRAVMRSEIITYGSTKYSSPRPDFEQEAGKQSQKQ